MMRHLFVPQALCCVLIALTLACAQKPASVVKAYQEAYNSGDVEKIVSLYAEDAKFENPGLFSLQGKDQLRQLAEYDLTLHASMEISQMKTRGDTVMCQLEKKDDWLETAKIEVAHCQAVFTVHNGLITSVEAKFAPETERVFRRAFFLLMDWAKVERPDMLAGMMSGDRFVYTADTAEKHLSLLRDFQQNIHRQGVRPAWKKLGE